MMSRCNTTMKSSADSGSQVAVWHARTHQRPFEARGVVEPSAHDEQGSLLIQLVCDRLDLAVQGQHLLYQL